MTTPSKSWRRIGLILIVNCIFWSVLVHTLLLHTDDVQATPTACTLPALPVSFSKAGFYVLAYDNGDMDQYTLEAKYQDTVSRLVTATINVPDSIVVILADLGEEGDTHILVAQNGVQTKLDCLPDENQMLDPAINEYDVTDGETLGDFLVWAKTTFSPADTTIFSYIGHGNPVTPYTVPPINDLLPPASASAQDPNRYEQVTGLLSPLPSQLDANPSFTDHHAPTAGDLGLITPYALASALAEATNNGADQFDIVDLLHCFAASIDELYEVAPYAKGLIGSPNYAFFDANMPGLAFEANLLEDYAAAYDSLHPPTEHPHIIIGIEGDTITNIADKWTAVSTLLMSEFATDASLTADRLTAAYLNSIKYDTTVCDADIDWALEPPDALSDMKSFAMELQTAYGSQNPALTSALGEVITALEGSISTTIAQSGTPYFETDNPDFWAFLTGESGVSLFTPFQPTAIEGELYLPWQTLWYTGTLSYSLPGNVQIENPKPFAFINSAANFTWADVVSRFWVERSLRPGVDVNTFFCTSELIPLKQETADLQTGLQVANTTITRGEKMTVTLTLSNTDIATATQPVLTFRPHSTPVDWLQLLTISPDLGCMTTDQVTRCELPDMPPGSAQEVQIIYQTLAGYPVGPPQLQFELQLFAKSYDPYPLDNHQTMEILVEPTIDLIYLPLIWRSD